MTYVVGDGCILCKHTDCVDVCPVDCFVEGPNFLAIDPDGCIDCAVCVPECPAEAIQADGDPGADKWIKLNAEFSKTWPQIYKKIDPPTDADRWLGVPGKYPSEFSEKPGEGS